MDLKGKETKLYNLKKEIKKLEEDHRIEMKKLEEDQRNEQEEGRKKLENDQNQLEAESTSNMIQKMKTKSLYIQGAQPEEPKGDKDSPGS